MPAGIKRSFLTAVRHCARALATAAVWTSWLVLSLVLVLQVYVASVRELQVPRFVLRAIEEHLAASDVSVKFGRAVFDPSGRLLIEKARFRLASFAEPVVTADAIYVRVDPWALLDGRFEPREVRATGANLFIPAMLSASGREEKIVQDLDAGFSIATRGDEFTVDYLNCRLGGTCLSAHGTINAGAPLHHGEPSTSIPLAQFVSRNYVALSREFSRAEEAMSGLRQPIVTAVMTPSDTRGAIVHAMLSAAGLSMAAPIAVDADDIRAEARFPLLGSGPITTSASLSAGRLRVAGKIEAAGVRVRAGGVLKMDTLSFDPRLVNFTARSVSGMGIEAVAPIARITPAGGKAFAADLSAWLQGSPVWAAGKVDLSAKSAEATFGGSAAPGLLEPVSALLGTDIRRFADLTEPLALAGSVRLSPGWKLAGGQVHVDGRHFAAYHVPFDEARGDISYDGTHLAAHNAVVRNGDNLAMGSYELDFSTLEYRYLLAGRIRPLDISAWFADWWPGVFKNYGFPLAPPDATIDVRGRYAHGRDFSVFGYVDSKGPVLLGVPVERGRVLLYVDPLAVEGLEITLTQGAQSAQASFKLATEPVSAIWTGLDIDIASTLDPTPLAKLLPADGAAAIEVFSFDQPPSISVRGHFDGPAVPGERHKKLHMEARAGTPLKIHGVSFDKAAFKVDIADDAVDVADIDAGFAGGTVTGGAQMDGEGAEKHLRFKASLTGASLGQAATAAEGYVASSPSGNSTALETFARDKSGVRLDLNVSASGRPAELSSFVGEGNFQIQGTQLGELSLLGGLSKFLKFPELRFTQARAEFKVEDSLLVFPELSVLGANSAIKAKGSYSIDRRQLDFTANVYPFQESKSILQIFNALSSPISAIFRVRLTGSLDKPSWNLAYSPLNLLREGDLKSPPADKPAPPSPLANPPP
jgi:hypothetical protein